MTTWGYARISTGGQDADLQRRALLAAGVEPAHLVEDVASGTRTERPGLDRLFGELREGDELVVWRLDRLGRSLSHLVELLDALGRRGVGFRSLTEALDTTTATGRLMAHIVASFAEFERELIVERTRAGLEAARASGKTLGRAPAASRAQATAVLAMSDAGVSQTRIAASVGLSRAVVGRIVRGEIEALRDVPRTMDGLDLYGPRSTLPDTP